MTRAVVPATLALTMPRHARFKPTKDRHLACLIHWIITSLLLLLTLRLWGWYISINLLWLITFLCCVFITEQIVLHFPVNVSYWWSLSNTCKPIIIIMIKGILSFKRIYFVLLTIISTFDSLTLQLSDFFSRNYYHTSRRYIMQKKTLPKIRM